MENNETWKITGLETELVFLVLQFTMSSQTLPHLILMATFFCFVLFFVFGCVVWLSGSQFPNQGLNLGHGSESAKS